MSAIPPPNWMSSILGAAGAQQRAGETKQKDDVAATDRVNPTEFAKKLGEAIATEERDAEVYADAEGAGGQGRAGSEKHEHKDEHPPADDQSPRDNACGGSVDFSA